MVVKSPRRWILSDHGGAFRTPNKPRPALEREMNTGGGRLRRSAPPACRSRVTADAGWTANRPGAKAADSGVQRNQAMDSEWVEFHSRLIVEPSRPRGLASTGHLWPRGSF